MSPDMPVNDGNIEISEAVIISFVEKTVSEFDGISLSKRRKSVKVTRSDVSNTIDLGLEVNYGTNIPMVVRELQTSIKERIVKLAGLNVNEVNVVVEGLNIEELIKK